LRSVHRRATMREWVTRLKRFVLVWWDWEADQFTPLHRTRLNVRSRQNLSGELQEPRVKLSR